ncbi:MAG: protein kinase [Candidatus Krumholzibacteriia bacterium]
MIGQTVSHYRILGKLGEGGMGVVYQAEDLKLDRKVALKFLPQQLSTDESARRRFIAEARTASALDHNNIITIHEIDQTPDGRMFIVMAYHEGQTLKERLEDGRLEIDDAVEITSQLVAGLASAHDSGIFHRDVKPGNILVTGKGDVKILDFGLAKLAGGARVTKTGTTVGTVAYMSPEQAAGREVDHRSDIFSLGVVLYEMLAGELPFPGDHEAAVVYGILHTDPEPVSSHRSDIPEALQHIVEKAMQKDLSRRYQDLHELWDDLTSLRGDAGRLPRRRRPRARMRLYGGVGLVTIAIAVVLGVLRFGAGGPALEDQAVAIVGFRSLDAAADPGISAGIRELVYIGLVESSPVRVVSPELLYDLRRRLFGEEQGPIAEGQTLEIARKSGATLLLLGSIGEAAEAQFVTWRLVDTRNGESIGARREQASTMTALTDRIIAGVLPLIVETSGVEVQAAPVPVDKITTASPDAYKHYVKGVLLRDQARDFESVAEFEAATALDTTFALAYFGLAQAHGSATIQDPAKANEYADKAWSLRTRLGIKDRLRLEAYRADLGATLSEAIDTYKETLIRWPDDRQTLRILVERLALHWSNDQVVETARGGLVLYPDDPVIGGTAYLHSLEAVGRTAEALAETRRYVGRHSDNPNAWDELGRRYLTVGLPDSAEAAYRKAIELDPTWYPEAIAYCAYHAGDLERAIAIMEGILGSGELGNGERVRLMIKSLHNIHLAALYREAGRYEDATRVCDATRPYLSSDRARNSNKLRMSTLLLAMGRAQDVLDITGELAGVPTAHWLRLGLRGSAQVALGDLDGARATSQALHGMERDAGAKARSLALRIDAEIALAEKRPEDALAALGEMKRRGVIFGGLYDIGHRESTARALQMAGRPAEAAETLEELVRVYGGHALGYYQLGHVYEDMGRVEDAEKDYARFLDMWSGADDGIPQWVAGRERLRGLRGGGS